MTADPATAPPDRADADPTPFQIFNEIGIIAQLSSNAFEQTMPHGMSMAQFGVLNHFVRLGGPRRPVELAQSFQVTKGAMTQTIAKLAEKGLVVVTDDPKDRRGKLVDVTPAGRQMRRDCVVGLSEQLAALRAWAPDDEWAAALPFLRRLRIWLDENR